jgi:hypothetical protein
MKRILIISLLVLHLKGTDSQLSVLNYLQEKGINFKSKSISGWIRVLEDEEKSKKYNLNTLTKKQKEKFIKELQQLQENN